MEAAVEFLGRAGAVLLFALSISLAYIGFEILEGLELTEITGRIFRIITII